MASAAQATTNHASICLYEECFQAAWDDYVLGHPQSTVFHLTSWKRVIERIFGYKAHYLFVEENGMIRGVLPLFLVTSPIQGRSLMSLPFAVYGGVCADDEHTARLLRAAACRLAEDRNVDYLELREQHQSISDDGFVTKDLYYSFDLQFPNSIDKLLTSFPRDTRYMIRKAEKNGLRSELGTQHLDIFYDIFAHSYHNLGTPVFPKRLFEVVLEEFGERCELMTIWRETKAVAAVLSFRFRDWIVPYYGGSYLESRQFAANNFMYWQVMKRGMETGARFFDFGRSKLNTGAYAFKTQWNMRQRPLPYQFFLVRRKTMPNFSPENPKFEASIALWRAMPVGLTKMLGPKVIRWFP
jgi:FemAB-related protein (PEP-CTERM system-associated)